MAWIEEEKRFLRRRERKKRIDLLEKYIEKVKKEHDVSKLSEIEDEEVILEMSKIAKELKKLKRVHRAEELTSSIFLGSISQKQVTRVMQVTGTDLILRNQRMQQNSIKRFVRSWTMYQT